MDRVSPSARVAKRALSKRGDLISAGLSPTLRNADVAQLVAHHLAKVRVAGSNPVVRSMRAPVDPDGGLARWDGREARQRPAKPCTRVRIPFPPRGSNTGRTLGHDDRVPFWTAPGGPAVHARAISSAGERFPDTEEVTGSIPVSPTTFSQVTALALIFSSPRGSPVAIPAPRPVGALTPASRRCRRAVRWSDKIDRRCSRSMTGTRRTGARIIAIMLDIVRTCRAC